LLLPAASGLITGNSIILEKFGYTNVVKKQVLQ